MKQSAIKEFTLWTFFMAIGVAVLATEVGVKAHRPEAEEIETQPVMIQLTAASSSSESDEALPEEIVAHLLVDSVVQIESGGKPMTVGSRGERGLMQIMRSTWRQTTFDMYGRSIPFDQAFNPELNRTVGTAYLSRMHAFLQENRSKWQSDERSLLLACYNAGPQRVIDAGFKLSRLPASTQDYVKRASALHDAYLQDHSIKLAPGKGRGVMQIVQLQLAVNS